jgi:hypothetical protein
VCSVTIYNFNDILESGRSEQQSPEEELCAMKSKNLNRLLHESEGKGLLGCLLSIVVLGVAVFLAIALGPIYYNNMNFESDLKTEVSRAAAHILSTDTMVKDILDLARRNEISLTKDNIKIEHYAGRVNVTVDYSVPVDLLVIERDFNFKISLSSFVGSL